MLTPIRKKNLISIKPETYVLPHQVYAGKVLLSQKLPELYEIEKNTLFIPKNADFSAIDLILKEDKNVWAIQVHVMDYDDVEPTFRTRCEEQGWFDAFENIFLLYPSPSEEITNSLSCLPTLPRREKKPRRCNAESRQSPKMTSIASKRFSGLLYNQKTQLWLIPK